MKLRYLTEKNRSFRKFDENYKISQEILTELIDLSRYCASGGNVQPLKYSFSCNPLLNEKIFPHLIWAGYLEDWDGPEPGERPSAYITVLLDKEISPNAGVNHGIAAQTIMLGAAEKGLGGCMIGSIRREKLHKVLNLSDNLEILLVLALGKPAETVVLEEIGENGSIKYYRDSNNVHYVPKRALKDILLGHP